jgi:ribosomal protein L40E
MAETVAVYRGRHDLSKRERPKLGALYPQREVGELARAKMRSMNCPGCGANLPDDSEDCRSCGARRLAGAPGHSETPAENACLSVVDVDLATRKVAKVTGHEDTAVPGSV